ncbi:MAG: sulfur carrier protein ThiS [Dokdonella sp.]
MKIILNGHEREIPAPATLTHLLEQAGFGGCRVAVEVNREIVPRSSYDRRDLAAGDHVEIVHAIGGG